jgi:hypothetical protein
VDGWRHDLGWAALLLGLTLAMTLTLMFLT